MDIATVTGYGPAKSYLAQLRDSLDSLNNKNYVIINVPDRYCNVSALSPYRL